MLELSLQILNGPSAGDAFAFTLPDGGSVSIGRARENDLVVSDPLASKFHAGIEYLDHSLRILDLESTQGTWLMGFRVGPHGNVISTGDECRIGSTIIRLDFVLPKSVEEIRTNATVASHRGDKRHLSKRQLILAGCVLLAGGLVALLPSGGNAGYQSTKAGELNIDKVYGFHPGRGTAGDTSHTMEVRFPLPVSDLLVEYEFSGDTPIALGVDEDSVTRLGAYPVGWQKWFAVVRDPVNGKERSLVFRRGDLTPANRRRHWAVRNVRVTSLEEGEGTEDAVQLGDAIRSAAEQSLVVRTGGGELFELLQSLQTIIALSLRDLDHVGGAAALDATSVFPSQEALRDQLKQIADERAAVSGEVPVEMVERHLQTILDLAATIDAELWRRVYNRLNGAIAAAKAKNYHDALAGLAAIRKMVPAESDERRKLSENSLSKAIPKRVLRHPDKYLKDGDIDL